MLNDRARIETIHGERKRRQVATEEKTEKATPKRRQDERKKGNVFQSSDVAAVYSLLMLFRSLKALVPMTCEGFGECVHLFFSYASSLDIFWQEGGKGLFMKAVLVFFKASPPLLFIGVLTAVIVTFFQTRMAFSWDVLKPKFDRVSPLKGFKRMFSLRSVIELLKSLIKITMLGWMAWLFLKGRLTELIGLIEGTAASALIYVGNTVVSLVDTVRIASVFLEAADYLYQWWEYEKNLRMSKQETKEEYKQTEGDPQIEGKIREKQRQMVSRYMIQNVPNTDVVIRNPTHLAVVLGYDSGKNRAPVVLVKGADHLALKIMEMAETSGVYIMESRPLARGLHDTVEVDMEIPEGYYQTVAKILALVYKLQKENMWLWINSLEMRFAADSSMIFSDRVTKMYGSGQKALNNVSLEVGRGEFVFLEGDSGTGRTTMLELILEETDPIQGNIQVNGIELAGLRERQIHQYRRYIGMVFQGFRLFSDLTIYENVAFAQRVVEADYKTMKRRVMEVLNQVGLGSKAKYYPDQPSGGEKQCTTIARAIVNRPMLLLADEPTGNLDQKNAEDIMRLLERINGQGTTVLVVSHNRELVRSMHRRRVVLRGGQVARDLARGIAAYGYQDIVLPVPSGA